MKDIIKQQLIYGFLSLLENSQPPFKLMKAEGERGVAFTARVEDTLRNSHPFNVIIESTTEEILDIVHQHQRKPYRKDEPSTTTDNAMPGVTSFSPF
jgi:hypothetical protein